MLKNMYTDLLKANERRKRFGTTQSSAGELSSSCKVSPAVCSVTSAGRGWRSTLGLGDFRSRRCNPLLALVGTVGADARRLGLVGVVMLGMDGVRASRTVKSIARGHAEDICANLAKPREYEGQFNEAFTGSMKSSQKLPGFIKTIKLGALAVTVVKIHGTVRSKKGAI